MLALNTAYFIYKIEVLEMVVACQEIPIILHTLNHAGGGVPYLLAMAMGMWLGPTFRNAFK